MIFIAGHRWRPVDGGPAGYFRYEDGDVVFFQSDKGRECQEAFERELERHREALEKFQQPFDWGEIGSEQRDIAEGAFLSGWCAGKGIDG